MLYFLFVKVPFPHFFRLLIAEQVLVDLFSQQLKKKKRKEKECEKGTSSNSLCCCLDRKYRQKHSTSPQLQLHIANRKGVKKDDDPSQLSADGLS